MIAYGPDEHDACKHCGQDFTEDNPEYGRSEVCEACESGQHDWVYDQAKHEREGN